MNQGYFCFVIFCMTAKIKFCKLFEDVQYAISKFLVIIIKLSYKGDNNKFSLDTFTYTELV